MIYEKHYFILLGIVITFGSFAQVPQKFNYQAVVRNNTGVIVANQNIAVKAEILDSNSTTVLYGETHAVTTNTQGLFSLQVGGGSVKSGVFASIDWTPGNRYIRTSVDLTGGTNFQLMGTNQLISVPYALQSLKATVAESLVSTSKTINSYAFPDENLYYWGNAIASAASFKLNGYSDWHIPTEIEMIQLIMKFGLTIFPPNEEIYYWTQTLKMGGHPTSGGSFNQPISFLINGEDRNGNKIGFGAYLLNQYNKFNGNPDKCRIIYIR